MKRKQGPSEADKEIQVKKQRTKGEVNKDDLFDWLPDELIDKIFKFLNKSDVQQLRLLNQRAFKIANITDFSLGLVLDTEVDEIIRVFGRYQCLIGLTFRKLAKEKRNIKLISQLTHLYALHLDSALNINLMTNLQALTLHSVEGEPDWSNFPHLTYIKSFKISRIEYLPTSLQRLQFHWTSTGFRATQQFLNLTYLKCPPQYSRYAPYIMPNLKRYESPADEYEGVFSCSLTALEKLKANIPVKDGNPECLTKLEINASIGWTHFSHLTNLNSLKSRTFPVENLKLNNFPLLERLSIKTEVLYKSMLENGSNRLTRLDVLVESRFPNQVDAFSTLTELRALHITTLNSFDCQLITALNNLTQFRITAPSVINLTLVNKLVKLTDLDVQVNQQHSADVNPFMGLSSLTSLSLVGLQIMAFHPNLFQPLDLQYLNLTARVFRYHDPIFINLTIFTNLTYLTTNLRCSWHEIVKLTKLRALHLKMEHCDDVDTANMTALAVLTRLEYHGHWPKGYKCPFTRLQSLEMPDKEKEFTQDLRFYSTNSY